LIHAKTMVEAEECLTNHSVDLILLDLGLPDAQGLDAVRRARSAAPHVAIVVLTGRDDETLAALALKEGAQDYLIKGQIESRALLRGLRYAFERKIMEEAARASIAQLQASERAAVQATGAMSAFLATMSHEIRTPLNGVLGMAQAMAKGELPELQRERLTVIQTAGEALLVLLNDLLDLSKIQAGKLELEDGLLDTQELADSALAFGVLVEERDLCLQVNLAPNAVGSWGADPKRVRQILHNLVSNAVKFTDQGMVSVDLFHDGGCLEMQVSDTGIGISEAHLARIFERFVQADATMTRRYGGSGLGLTICRDLVSLMDGEIRVESVEGSGTTFTVLLPLGRVEPVGAVEPASNPPAPAAHLGGLRVLAAEDNPMNRLVLKTLLSEVGIEPVVVLNGEEAVEAWRTGTWDIVLMDVQMPVLDGVSAVRLIRAIEGQEGRSRTPVIALTANAMSHHRSDYLEAGMDDLVAKPISLSALLQAMDAAMAPMHSEPAGLIGLHAMAAL
jgi:signal transduction histidine kinase